MTNRKQYCITAINILTTRREPVTPPCSLKTARRLLDRMNNTPRRKDTPYSLYIIEAYPKATV